MQCRMRICFDDLHKDFFFFFIYQVHMVQLGTYTQTHINTWQLKDCDLDGLISSAERFPCPPAPGEVAIKGIIFGPCYTIAVSSLAAKPTRPRLRGATRFFSERSFCNIFVCVSSCVGMYTCVYVRGYLCIRAYVNVRLYVEKNGCVHRG